MNHLHRLLYYQLLFVPKQRGRAVSMLVPHSRSCVHVAACLFLRVSNRICSPAPPLHRWTGRAFPILLGASNPASELSGAGLCGNPRRASGTPCPLCGDVSLASRLSWHYRVAFYFILFCILGLYLWHMQVPGPGTESKLHVHATAVAKLDSWGSN